MTPGTRPYRVNDGGVTLFTCPGCGQDTIYTRLCSDCQVDVIVGVPPGTAYRSERARDLIGEAVATGLGGTWPDPTAEDIAAAAVAALIGAGLLADRLVT